MPRVNRRSKSRDAATLTHIATDRPSVTSRRVPDPEKVALRAYQRFEMRGCVHGRDQEDWFEAERELTEASDE
jgi:hypothetical protein